MLRVPIALLKEAWMTILGSKGLTAYEGLVLVASTGAKGL